VSRKVSRLGVAALYLVASLAPVGHELLFTAPACPKCEALLDSGPSFEAVCDDSGSCADPEHHHHPHRHQHKGCPLCQHGAFVSLTCLTFQFQVVEQAAEFAPLSVGGGSLGLFSSHRARAPPDLS
jgi:hypothetical protein